MGGGEDYLILDLRGNTGGNSFTAQRLFSVFTSHPINYMEYQYFNNEEFTETCIVTPHKRYQYNSLSPIVILIDGNTSCASEEFIAAMKQLRNVTIIGSSPTRGVLASRIDLVFPSGTLIYSDSILPKIILRNLGSVETVGIAPDVKVLLRNVNDLYPYDDKILEVAIAYLANTPNPIREQRLFTY